MERGGIQSGFEMDATESGIVRRTFHAFHQGTSRSSPHVSGRDKDGIDLFGCRVNHARACDSVACHRDVDVVGDTLGRCLPPLSWVRMSRSPAGRSPAHCARIPSRRMAKLIVASSMAASLVCKTVFCVRRVHSLLDVLRQARTVAACRSLLGGHAKPPVGNRHAKRENVHRRPCRRFSPERGRTRSRSALFGGSLAWQGFPYGLGRDGGGCRSGGLFCGRFLRDRCLRGRRTLGRPGW